MNECEGCDIHSDVCGNPDFCCTMCPELRRRERADTFAYQPTQPLGVTFDFNAKPATVKYHGMDVCTSCDQLAHECKCVPMVARVVVGQSRILVERDIATDVTAYLHDGTARAYKPDQRIKTQRGTVRAGDLMAGDVIVEPCPTSRTTLTGILIAIAVICGLALVLIALSSCARRETPAQQGVLTTAKESPNVTATATSSTSTVAEDRASGADPERERPTGDGTLSRRAGVRPQATRETGFHRSDERAATPLPLLSAATDTAQPLKPAESRKVTFPSASVVAPAQVRRRAVGKGRPPRVVRIDDHPEMIEDHGNHVHRYNPAKYTFIAVQYAAEGIRDGRVFQVDYLECACMSTGYPPRPPFVSGSWLVFPIPAPYTDARGYHERYFGLGYFDDARNRIIEKARVTTLPTMAFAELR